jgi:N-acetylmuramoyl-L-alanine amidase
MQEYHSGGSIRNIIFQKGQFDCVTEEINNSYNAQNIYNMVPEQIHYAIADWAIAGNRLNETGESLWFMNPFKPSCPQTFPYNGSGNLHNRINDHCFYEPTEIYKDT